MSDLLNPPREAMIYENEKLYVCLASHPLTEGHAIVAWKADVADIHSLDRDEYEHLMWVVDCARNALLKTFKLNKVYLMYLDETNHVHWHLVPRYEVKGYNLLKHNPHLITDFSLSKQIKQNFSI